MEILIILILVLLNGIFSMSEVSLISSRKFRLESEAKKGNSNAKKALELANNPNRFLSTVQIGITLIGILTGIFSGEKITTDLTTAIEKIALFKPYAHTIAVLVVVVIITYLSIVFGELIPKRIGLLFPESIAATVAKPMSLLSVVASPFIWLLTITNNLFFKIFGIKDNGDEKMSEAEIKAIIQDSAAGGEIQKIEQSIVERVFALGDRKVKDLMTHRTDLVTFTLTDDLVTIKQRAQIEIHSVYPVITSRSENPIGVVSVKDIFPRDFRNKDFNLSDFLKKPLMVAENTPAYKVLEMFKEQKIHYAFVIDEYGTVQGMTAMDDLVDALLGDMTEYNQQEFGITKRDEKSWLVDGQYPFYEFLHYFNLPSYEEQGDYNTISGLIIHELARIPHAGDKIRWKQFELEVVDMDGHRIDKILVSRIA